MEKLWRWLYLEYKNALGFSSDIIIANLPRRYHHLFPRNRIFEKSVLDMYPSDRIIILDPKARETLSHDKINTNDVIVVGGILGFDPPLGRTYKLLTSRIKDARSYNIGEKQLSIDGAVYVALRILHGENFCEIKFIDDYYILTNVGSIVKLPYRYPLINEKPVISKELLRLIYIYGLPFGGYGESIWGEVR